MSYNWFVCYFVADFRESSMTDSTNDSQAAILSMVPPIFHKYLTTKSRNQSHGKFSMFRVRVIKSNTLCFLT